jgi:hypothetical protein
VPEPSGCKTAEAAQETATLCHWCHESRRNCDVTLRLYSKEMRREVTAARGTGRFCGQYRAFTVSFKKNVKWTEALFTLRVEFLHYVRMRWAEHVARMGEGRGVHRVLVGEPEGKRPLGRPRRRWEDNIKMYFYSFYFHQRMHINWKHFHYLHSNHNAKSMWRVSDQ